MVECARPRAQQPSPRRRGKNTQMLSCGRESLRPRTGALRRHGKARSASNLPRRVQAQFQLFFWRSSGGWG
jgi:hypothetical protein